MPGIPAGREARPVADSARNYERRRPDETLLYRIIEQYYPVLSALMAEQGRELPAYLRREFEDYLQGLRLTASSLFRHGCHALTGMGADPLVPILS